MTDDHPPGLYIHIPFCRTKCHYCGFYSTTALARVPDFLQAIGKEMDIYRGDFGTFDTIYIGGGTPSVLSVKDLSTILAGVAEKFNVSPQAEITLEANPGDLSLTLLQDFRRLEINRLNLGIQSFDDDALSFLGRRHSRQQAILAIEIAHRAGFDNLGLDLIYGLPGQSLADWLGTLRQALSFQPSHLSCYQLTIEPKTPLGIRHLKGEVSLPDAEMLADLFFQTAAALEQAGYLHYEVSNFARDAASLSKHNQKYWRHTPYLGLGPAAHSFCNNKRWGNHRDLARYINDLKSNAKPIDTEEMLTPAELRLEALFLGLRTKKGIDLDNFRERYGCDLLTEKRATIAHLIDEELLEISGGRLRPTLAGMAVADSLACI
ncbi:MAG: radical SAM family heme chaperone HemW [Deltaproteobacteria bacterium]|nr:radical SAM family heme chaperone HemW [Deltaproteobacteria bacterium]